MDHSTSSATRSGFPLPPLTELGRDQDLLRLAAYQRWITIVLPLIWVAAFVLFAWAGSWPLACFAAAAYTFYSYGSTSHDLVHHSLGLSPRVGHALLSLIELAGLRSGHAYRAAHLHHHARFPHNDDVEGAAAHGSFIGALLAGPLHQPGVWWWAMRHAPHDRGWIIVEGIACVVLLIGSIAAWPITSIPLAYVALVVVGSWTFPVFTGYLPHNPTGADALRQTRRFRGTMAALLFRHHLYHLEHHLYPAVPHQHWPRLAERLDPYLDRAGVRSIYLGF